MERVKFTTQIEDNDEIEEVFASNDIEGMDEYNQLWLEESRELEQLQIDNPATDVWNESIEECESMLSLA